MPPRGVAVQLRYGPFVYRLGRKIFILERAVRFCYGLPPQSVNAHYLCVNALTCVIMAWSCGCCSLRGQRWHRCILDSTAICGAETRKRRWTLRSSPFPLVALPGLEPGNAAPKTVVLPLHYKAILMSSGRLPAANAVQNYCFFLNYNPFSKIFLKSLLVIGL